MSSTIQLTPRTKEKIGQINEAIEALHFGDHPKELYDPLTYIMQLGGKRMRPLLVLLGYELFHTDSLEALDVACGVEMFHNFTLMHDDIMDKAPLRRGKDTVHIKWNEPTAILSGDVMLVKSYEQFLNAPTEILKPLLKNFNTTAAEVCEGQQIDMNFENRNDVTEEEYINMIRLKTAVLLGFSLQTGAMLAGASQENQELIYKFGIQAGIGFQIMDDLLDVYADKAKFGKQVGGDIMVNKKTIILIKALNLTKKNIEQKASLEKWLKVKEFDPEEKVKAVTEIYNSSGAKQETIDLMNQYFDQAFETLKQIPSLLEGREELINFTNYLIKRES